MKNKFLFWFIPALLLGLIAACDVMPDWFGGEKEEKKLPGERISVMEEKNTLKADENSLNTPINLPEPKANDFFQDEGYQAVQNIAFAADNFKETATDSSGNPSPREFRLTASPLIAEGKVFILDGEGVLFAHDAGDIKKILWKAKLYNKGDNFLSGGIAYDARKIFITTANGDIICLAAENGSEIWRKKIAVPIKSAPIAKAERLFFITVESELYALSAEDGRALWTHAGIASSVGILGAATPLVTEKYIVVPYSSGEIYGIGVGNGKVLWTETLGSKKTLSSGSLFALSDIDADPVTDGRIVYSGSNQGVFAAKEIDNGKAVWEKEISILKTPWLAGDYIFLIDTDGEAIALNRKNAKIRWITQLEKKKAKEERTAWQGPVLAGGQLIISGSNGLIYILSPETGKIVKTTKVIKESYLRPAIANNTLYLLNNEGILASYH